jgi:hypothetical protein
MLKWMMAPLAVSICAVIAGTLVGMALRDAIAQKPFPTPGVWSCEDGIDNDGDTLIDFDDPHCWHFGEEPTVATATPVPTAAPTPESTTAPTATPVATPSATPAEQRPPAAGRKWTRGSADCLAGGKRKASRLPPRESG